MDTSRDPLPRNEVNKDGNYVHPKNSSYKGKIITPSAAGTQKEIAAKRNVEWMKSVRPEHSIPNPLYRAARLIKNTNTAGKKKTAKTAGTAGKKKTAKTAGKKQNIVVHLKDLKGISSIPYVIDPNHNKIKQFHPLSGSKEEQRQLAISQQVKRNPSGPELYALLDRLPGPIVQKIGGLLVEHANPVDRADYNILRQVGEHIDLKGEPNSPPPVDPHKPMSVDDLSSIDTDSIMGGASQRKLSRTRLHKQRKSRKQRKQRKSRKSKKQRRSRKQRKSKKQRKQTRKSTYLNLV